MFLISLSSRKSILRQSKLGLNTNCSLVSRSKCLVTWIRRNGFANASGVQFGGEEWILSPKKETITHVSAWENCAGVLWAGRPALCLQGRKRPLTPSSPATEPLCYGTHTQEGTEWNPRFCASSTLPSASTPGWLLLLAAGVRLANVYMSVKGCVHFFTVNTLLYPGKWN